MELPNEDREVALGIVEVFRFVTTADEEHLVETGSPHRVGSDELTDLFGDVLKIGNQTTPGSAVDALLRPKGALDDEFQRVARR
jgi:hypothetical protein